MKSVTDLQKASFKNDLIRDENKINILAIQPGLSQNEYYSLIQPKYYFSNNDNINYQVSRITSYKDISNVDLLLTEANFADIIILPQSLQDYSQLINAAKHYNKNIRIGMLQEIDPELLTKTMLQDKFVNDLKKQDISLEDYFSAIKKRMLTNIELVDFIIVSSTGLKQSFIKTKPTFLIEPVPVPEITFENVDYLDAKREQYVNGFLSILIDCDVDNIENINTFLKKMSESKIKNCHINIIGDFMSKIDYPYSTFGDCSIIHRPKLIKEINPDIYIDFTKCNGPNMNSYSGATIKEMVLFNIYPIIPLKIAQSFSNQYKSYKSLNDLIKIIQVISLSDMFEIEELVVKRLKYDSNALIDKIENTYEEFLLDRL